MALPSAYAQYNNSKVLTASPAELTLMLYDGAIKFCNIAELSIEKNDIPRAHENIRKVQNIIGYLHSTLDMKYEVSRISIIFTAIWRDGWWKPMSKRIRRFSKRSTRISIRSATTGKKS